MPEETVVPAPDPVTAPDTDSMTPAQLREAFSSQKPEAVADEPVAAAADVEPEPEDDNTPDSPNADPKKKFSQSIDLGDGQFQTYYGGTRKDLAANIAKAQEHAARTIREMKAEIAELKKAKEAPAPAPVTEDSTEFTTDEAFMLSQEMLSAPDKAFDKIFRKRFGFDPGELKTKIERVDAVVTAQQTQAVAKEFVTETGFYESQENIKKIDEYLGVWNLPLNKETLTRAYTELSTRGLLDAAPDVEPTQAPPPAPRRTSSAIATRSGVRPAPRTVSPEDTDKMTPAELRKLAFDSPY